MEPLFSLFAEDNENFGDFCTTVRQYITDFSPSDFKVENIVRDISHLGWEPLGMIIRRMIDLDFRVENNLQFEEPITDIDKIDNIVLNLPITSLLLAKNDTHAICPFRFLKNDTYVGNLEEYERMLADSSTILTEEEVELLFDQTKELEGLLGIQINKAGTTTDDDNDIPHWSCNSINCTHEGDGTQSFIEHYRTHHNDNLCGLKIIWADTIRWTREKGCVPTLGDLSKPIFVGLLRLVSQEGEEQHMFFNKDKYDISVSTAEKLEDVEIGKTYDTETNTSKISIDIYDGGFMHNTLSNLLPQSSITTTTHEHRCFSMETIQALYNPDFILAENDNNQFTSVNFNENKKVVGPDKYEEVKTFITDEIKNLSKAVDINNFITQKIPIVSLL